MEDIRGIEVKGSSLEASPGVRKKRKPGPKKKSDTRTEKESCRLTKEEKEERRAYCKKYGIKPADLLRAAYLSATFSESERYKIVFDVSVMLRELKLDAEEMREEFTGKADAHSAARMASMSFRIAAILKRLTISIGATIPIVIASLYMLSLMNINAGAAHTGGQVPYSENAFLIGFFIGVAIDLVLLLLLLPYQRKLDRWIARRLWKLLRGPQIQRRFAEERRHNFEQHHLASRNSSK